MNREAQEACEAKETKERGGKGGLHIKLTSQRRRVQVDRPWKATDQQRARSSAGSSHKSGSAGSSSGGGGGGGGGGGRPNAVMLVVVPVVWWPRLGSPVDWPTNRSPDPGCDLGKEAVAVNPKIGPAATPTVSVAAAAAATF